MVVYLFFFVDYEVGMDEGKIGGRRQGIKLQWALSRLDLLLTFGSKGRDLFRTGKKATGNMRRRKSSIGLWKD